MTAETFMALSVDPRVAPGWSREHCVARQAFLVRVSEDTAWVAAVNPLDVTVVDDIAWLCRRRQINVIQIDNTVLTEAIRRLYDAPQSGVS